MTSPIVSHIRNGLDTFDFSTVKLPAAKPYRGESQHAAVRGATNRIVKAFNAHVGHDIIALEVSGRSASGRFGEHYVQGASVGVKSPHRSFRADQDLIAVHIEFVRHVFDALTAAGWNRVEASRGTDSGEWDHPSFVVVGTEVAEHAERSAQIKLDAERRKTEREAAVRALVGEVRDGFANYGIEARIDEYNQTVSLAAVRDLLVAVDNRYSTDDVNGTLD